MDKNFRKIFVLAAFILSSSLPIAGYAARQEENPLPKEEECVAWNESAPEGKNDSETLAMEDSSPSSYQGTTTGPGPNGGYPGSPRGSYNVINPPKQNSR